MGSLKSDDIYRSRNGDGEVLIVMPGVGQGRIQILVDPHTLMLLKASCLFDFREVADNLVRYPGIKAILFSS